MSLADFNGFDALLAMILLISMAMGFWRGFVRAALGLAGMIGGFALASANYTRLGDWIKQSRFIDSVSGSRIAAFLLIVAAVVLFMQIAARLLRKTIHAVGLGLLDRACGAAFGFVRGVAFGIGVLLIATTVAPQAKVVTTSVLSPYFFAVAHDVSFLVPDYLQSVMLNGANLKQSPPNAIRSR
jgi:membrane protein required for colicin V production